MVAQIVDVGDSSGERLSTNPLLADIAAGIAFLRERGALSFGRSYVAATRASGDQILLSARASGARSAVSSYLVDAQSASLSAPPSIQDSLALLRVLLGELDHQSALLVPAPHLTAFAVAGLPLPIVYGSGLLRRTPEALAVVPWTSALDSAAVLNVIKAHHRSSAVLLVGRGVLAYSNEPVSKLAKFVSSLEESAQLTFNAQLLGGARPLPPDAYQQMQAGIAGD